MNLIDIGFRGSPTISNNRHNGRNNIQEHLDRSLCCSKWLFHYTNALVHHLSDIGSNHRPHLLTLNPSMPKAKKFFSFDSRWLSNPDVEQTVANAWNVPVFGSTMFKIFSKFKACCHALVNWNKVNARNAKTAINDLQYQLEVQSKPVIIGMLTESATLKRIWNLKSEGKSSIGPRKQGKIGFILGIRTPSISTLK